MMSDPGLPWSPVTMTGGSEGKLASPSWECSFFSSLLPVFIFRFLFVLLLAGWGGEVRQQWASVTQTNAPSARAIFF